MTAKEACILSAHSKPLPIDEQLALCFKAITNAAKLNGYRCQMPADCHCTPQLESLGYEVSYSGEISWGNAFGLDGDAYRIAFAAYQKSWQRS